MRIGIDGLVLREQNAGSLRIFAQLLESLANAQADHEYVVFASPKVLQSLALPHPPNFHFRPVNPFPRLPAAVQQQAFSGWHSAGTLDLLHCPVFVPPLAYPGKTVMTVFDLTYRLYPKSQKWTGRLWWRLLGPAGMRKADHLITISENTRREVNQYIGIARDKISVIYPYFQEHFHPVDNARQITQKYHLPENYILFTGTLERRKNIVTLLHAFSRARQSSGLRHALVLVGKRGWLYEDIFRTIAELNIGDQVIFPGYVAEEDLPALYSAADLFVFLSSYEGFGFPVLEAMACGTPVLCSNVASLPEVAGQAAIQVPPDDPERAANEMLRILTDPVLQAALVERGLVQARCFSRQRFQSQTLEVYARVVAGATD